MFATHPLCIVRVREAERYMKGAERKRMVADTMHLLEQGGTENKSFPPDPPLVSHQAKAR